uniref:MIF4G domain-containing protein n=1 Tax=Pyrodinium bahamense TaxID=73915 RepID=A0A7S0B3B4_9DINO
MAARKGGLGPVPEESGGGEDGAGVAALALPAVLADPQHPLEAPWDYFRIKLVCVLLDTCGHYFDHGADKLKLDRFLTFFSRYVHTKGELPLRFMNMVHDTLERLRPRLVFPPSQAVADEAVLKLLQQERETLDLGEERAEEREEEGGDEESTDDEDSGSEDEDDSSNEEEDSDDEESESEDDDEGAYDRGEEVATKHAEELEEFDREVQQLLIDSLEREKHAPRVMSELPAPPPIAKRPEGSGEPGVFSLLQRKPGGKMLLKQIDIPDDSKLIRASRASELEASKEQADLKSFIMHSVQNPTQAVSSSLGSGVRMRAGKGGHKGGYHFDPRSRKNMDYVKDEFLPEDDRPEPPVLQGRVTVRYKGSGRGGRGGSGSHATPRSAGGRSGGWGGGGSGGRSRPEPRGTPSAAVAQGSL